MSQKLKTPAKAATKDGGDTTTQHPKHTPKQNVCKYPRCQLQGPASMSFKELLQLYFRLLRQGG